MGVVYEDRPILEEKAAKDASKHVSGASQRSECLGKAAGKRKTREPTDVRIGRELAKPDEKKSRKVCFYLGEYTGETSLVIG